MIIESITKAENKFTGFKIKDVKSWKVCSKEVRDFIKIKGLPLEAEIEEEKDNVVLKIKLVKESNNNEQKENVFKRTNNIKNEDRLLIDAGNSVDRAIKLMSIRQGLEFSNALKICTLGLLLAKGMLENPDDLDNTSKDIIKELDFDSGINEDGTL